MTVRSGDGYMAGEWVPEACVKATKEQHAEELAHSPQTRPQLTKESDNGCWRLRSFLYWDWSFEFAYRGADAGCCGLCG
ncbi:hypothetical protein GCM10027038_13840 [Arthrobacter bambusae]